MTFLPTLPSGNENSECKWNPIPSLLYTYLSGTAFLANLTSPNKQSFKVKLEFKFKFIKNKENLFYSEE